MSEGAHVVLKRKKPGEWILEVGWDKLDVAKVVEPFCLTKPETAGSLNHPHYYEWTVWNYREKEELAQFPKEKDAREYFDYILKTRQ